MWKLVKNEWSYNLLMLVLALLMLSIVFPMMLKLERTGYFIDTAFTNGTTVILLYLLFPDRFSEKRIRFMAGLPVSDRQVALVRLASQFPYWLGSLSLYALNLYLYLPASVPDTVVYSVSSLSAALFMANAAICIMIDLMTDQMKRKSCLNIGISILLILTVAGWIALQTYTKMHLHSHEGCRSILIALFYTPTGIFIQHGLALVFYFASYRIYRNRNGFLM